MLKLTLFDDVDLFKKEVIPYLEKDEIINGLVLGLILALKDEKPKLMATVQRAGNIILVLFQTSPKQIILSKADLLSNEEINQLSKLIDSKIIDIPGFVGEKNLTVKLANEIVKLRGFKSEVFMNQRIYRLDQLLKKAEINDGLVKLETKDHLLVREWVYQFSINIGDKLTKEEADKKALDLIEKGRLYAWEVDGEIVSMANGTRPTKSNINLNFVYTPPSERKKGYASSCVSALTELFLQQGFRTTSLYTDLDNPTSNKIYLEIGYKPIIDSIVIYFH